MQTAGLILSSLFLFEMSRYVDDGFLSALIELCEVSHVSCYTNHESLVVLRILLSVSQSLGINNVDLDVLSAMIEEGLDDAFDYVESLFAFNALRVESQVEERSVMESILSHGSY